MKRFSFLIVACLAIASITGCDNSSERSGPSKKQGPFVSKYKDLNQDGAVLGNPTAKVTIFEYGDLLCTYCKSYNDLVLPFVIKNLVATGKAKYVYKNVGVVGQGSTAAAYSAIAARQQNHFYDFIDEFYKNQQPEGTNYVTSEFQTTIAENSGLNIERWYADLSKAKISQYADEIKANEKQAKDAGATGAPAFLLVGPTGKKQLIEGAMPYVIFAKAYKKVAR